MEEDPEEVDDDYSGWETASDVDEPDALPSNAEAVQQDGASTQVKPCSPTGACQGIHAGQARISWKRLRAGAELQQIKQGAHLS